MLLFLIDYDRHIIFVITNRIFAVPTGVEHFQFIDGWQVSLELRLEHFISIDGTFIVCTRIAPSFF